MHKFSWQTIWGCCLSNRGKNWWWRSKEWWETNSHLRYTFFCLQNIHSPVGHGLGSCSHNIERNFKEKYLHVFHFNVHCVLWVRSTFASTAKPKSNECNCAADTALRKCVVVVDWAWWLTEHCADSVYTKADVRTQWTNLEIGSNGFLSAFNHVFECGVIRSDSIYGVGVNYYELSMLCFNYINIH